MERLARLTVPARPVSGRVKVVAVARLEAMAAPQGALPQQPVTQTRTALAVAEVAAVVAT